MFVGEGLVGAAERQGEGGALFAQAQLHAAEHVEQANVFQQGTGGGADGVSAYIDMLKREFTEAMYMVGARKVSDLCPEMIR